MSQQQDSALSNIRNYAVEAREFQEGQMGMDASRTEARLDQTIQELRTRVQEQQIALAQLRESSHEDLRKSVYASEDRRERLKQLHTVRDAYKQLKHSVPFLPAQDSALPALLAARSLQQNIKEAKESIASTEEQIARTNATLQKEEANLRDAKSISTAMENRIGRLRAQHEERSQKTPAQLAKDLIASKREKKEAYDAEFGKLSEAFHDFTADVLATMLAAEELGGPVVGDMPVVEDETLAAGFTRKGKAKSSKKAPSDSLRQRRIDQIWGDKAMDDGEQLGEADAADNEMRKLIEGLFATLSGPGGGKAYYELPRDSAASRFLVRAKIAQFHPKDARKLRLIDFGRELDN